MADELWVRWVYASGPPSEPWNVGTRDRARASTKYGCAIYLEALNTGERFYPEPPKPAPERVGTVAKRVRDWMRHLYCADDARADLARLLACAEASDYRETAREAYERAVGVPNSVAQRFLKIYDAAEAAWRRTVTGD